MKKLSKAEICRRIIPDWCDGRSPKTGGDELAGVCGLKATMEWGTGKQKLDEFIYWRNLFDDAITELKAKIREKK